MIQKKTWKELETMSFLPELKMFLSAVGRIYTVRKYKMSEADVMVIGVGLCYRKPVGTIKIESDLKPYVRLSGFSTTKEWWDKITYFIPDPTDTKYLYRVTR